MRVVFLRVVGAAEKTLTGPDLQIRGGPGHPYLKMGGRGGAVSKNIFSALGASVWFKNEGEARALPGPFPRSATEKTNKQTNWRSLPQYLTRKAEQCAFWQRNHRWPFAWPLAQRY